MFDFAEAVPYAGKSLRDRNAGRFYTPDFLADHLAEQVINELLKAPRLLPLSASICDPFCGDGQLLVPFIRRLAAEPSLRRAQLTVVLRDIEAAAVAEASARVHDLATLMGMRVAIDARPSDTFEEFEPGRFDVVLTNPPWEQLKPDLRETAHLSDLGRKKHEDWLRWRSGKLDGLFPDARASVRWGAWSTSLARCGWDVSLQSCRLGGVLGIVLPGSLFGDRASARMRESALARAKLVDLSAFPPEARLFAKVDQPVVSAVFRVEKATELSTSVRIFDSERRVVADRSLRWTQSELSDRDFVIPLTRNSGADQVLAELRSLPTFGDLEGAQPSQLWAGRELDETRIHEKLVASGSKPFVKGRMIGRRQLVERPDSYVKESLAGGLHSAQFERLVWRDVSRPTQKRRMIATIIPPGWVAGNSLHVAHFRDGNGARLRALRTLLSSLVFEAQVRSSSSTGHVSLGVVRNTRIPVLRPKAVERLARADQAAARAPEGEFSAEVEAAKVYGLCRQAFAALLEEFPKLDHSERERLLAKDHWGSR